MHVMQLFLCYSIMCYLCPDSLSTSEGLWAAVAGSLQATCALKTMGLWEQGRKAGIVQGLFQIKTGNQFEELTPLGGCDAKGFWLCFDIKLDSVGLALRKRHADFGDDLIIEGPPHLRPNLSGQGSQWKVPVTPHWCISLMKMITKNIKMTILFWWATSQSCLRLELAVLCYLVQFNQNLFWSWINFIWIL